MSKEPPVPAAVEAIAEASLFEQYADEVITFRGVTAPLGALINLCPVPKDQMDPARVEAWTADILTQAGVEIQPNYLPDPALESKKKLS